MLFRSSLQKLAMERNWMAVADRVKSIHPANAKWGKLAVTLFDLNHMLQNPKHIDDETMRTFYGVDLIDRLARFVLGYEADEKAELKKIPTSKNATEQTESKEVQSISFRERLYTLL